MKKSAIQVLAVVIGLLVSVAALNALKKCEATTGSRHYKTIGHLTNVDGQVERRKPGAVQMESVPSPREIFNQDMLVTQKSSTATLQLEPDGPTLRLNENSRFIAELDASKPGAFIGTLLDGTITVLNPGRQGSFRLFQEGREIAPENADKKSVPVIPSDTSAGGSPAPAISATPLVTITATHLEETATPIPSAAPSESSETSDVLTNDEIIRTLRSQTGLFQRCYLSFIHRAGQATGAGTAAGSAVTATPSPQPSASKSQTGTVTLGFTIQSSGKITAAKIVRSDFGDTTLHNCVTEVVERTRFKPFKGPSIPVLEFPIALQ